MDATFSDTFLKITGLAAVSADKSISNVLYVALSAWASR
jgi:hypothetical protein